MSNTFIKTTKVSIIIPVFNVQKYLKRNIESVLHQTYHNLEIIYINDGSTDSSGDILEYYRRLDPRIKVIHNSNHGVSFSRNCGLDHATGEYVIFIDGDDYVETDYVEYLISLIINSKCNVAISSQHFFDNQTLQTVKLDMKIRSAISIIDDIYLNKIYMAVWNKIYSLDFIKQNGIRFNETLWYAEGMHFNVQILSLIDKIAVGNKKVYHYITNPNSAMRKSFSLKNEKCALKSLALQRILLENSGYIECFPLEFHCMMINFMILCGITDPNNNCYDEFEFHNSVDNIHKRKGIPLKVKLSLKERLFWLLVAYMPVLMAKRGVSKKQSADK